MNNKLFQFYSLDECSNFDLLYKNLDKLKDEGKIDYKTPSKEIIQITDLSLDDNEINPLIKFLDSLDISPYLGYENIQEIDSNDDSSDEYTSDFDDDHYDPWS